MGLLTKINLSQLKSELAEKISPSPKVDFEAINWGSLGDFIFSIYRWSEQFSWTDEDEYVQYKTLAGFVEKERASKLNRRATLVFKLFQRQEDNVFEEDLFETISLINAEKESGDPLQLLKNNGELYIGSFSINEMDVTIDEEDNKGLPIKATIKLELESYPDSQL